jgi:hemolysin III
MENIKKELANAISHGFGVLFGIVASPVIIGLSISKNNSTLTFAVAFYCFCMLMMFTFSTLYHSFVNATAKKVLRIFDHISIFFMIGGSYAPFIVLFTDAQTADTFFILQWSLIIIGVILKIFYTGRFRLFSSLVYIFIGSMIFFIDFSFWSRIPQTSLFLLISGGLSYLIGVVFYQNRKIPYNHFKWHLFVLSAAILHYMAIFNVLK